MVTLAGLPALIAARGPRPALVRRCGADGFRDWSTTDLIEAIQQGAAALLATGLAAGDRLAIVSESRPEWILIDLAAQTIGVVTVPIYPTLPAPQVRYILADSGARVAIVSDRIQAAKVQEVRHLLPALELVVIIDPGTPADAGDPQPVTWAWVRPSSPAPRSSRAAASGWRSMRRSDRPSRPAAPRSAPNRSPPSSTPPARRASPRA